MDDELKDLVRAQTIVLMRLYDLQMAELFIKKPEEARKLAQFHESGGIVYNNIKYVEEADAKD